jgi:hypothetical protein
VALGGTLLHVGTSDVRRHPTNLPETDEVLIAYGSEVSFRSMEHLSPEVSGVCTVAESSSSLSLTRVGGNPYGKSVYEVKQPLPVSANVMGHVRLRKEAWPLSQPDWFYKANTASPYVGLRHNQYTSGVDVFFQGGGSPGLWIVGPLQAFQQVRYYEHFVAFDWVSLPNGTPIDIWIVVAADGFIPPASPAYAPTAEVWAGAGSYIPASRLVRLPIGNFGLVPGGVAEDSVSLLFGNGSAVASTINIEDWGIYPDFRVAIDNGDPRTQHEVVFSAASPTTYRAATKKEPEGWDFVASGAATSRTFGYQPGNRAASQALRVTKTGTGYARYERDEPILATATEASLEVFCAGLPTTYDGNVFGAGIELDDGTHVFRVMMLREGTGSYSLGLALDGAPNADASYFSRYVIDFQSLRIIRLTVDKVRDEVRLYVDGNLVLSVPLSTTAWPATVGTPAARMGHLINVNSTGRFDLVLSNLYTTASSFETAPDGGLPPAPFVLAATTGNTATAGLVLHKTDFGVPFSGAVYSAPIDMDPYCGAWTEFSVKVVHYSDSHGTDLATVSSTGVGVKLNFGQSLLTLVFVDSGSAGRYVGIVPGSGSIDDLVNQTQLGRKFSTPFDWTEKQTYRLHYKPYESIEVWVGSVVSSPQIVIPWSDGFDIPAITLGTSGITFGHISSDESGQSEWDFFRFGGPTGYDINVEQLFSADPAPYHYGGQSAYLLQFLDG